MDLLQDRQDAAIWNAIENKSYKTALRLVDKRIAKKSTEYLRALRLYIKALPRDSITECYMELEGNSLSPSAPTDHAAVELYSLAFDQVYLKDNESCNISSNWARLVGKRHLEYVKAHPKDEQAAQSAFEACISRNDLEHAVAISTSLENNFPNSHNYIFWNISTCFRYANSSNCPRDRQKIYNLLALRKIEKLAEITIQADPNKLPIKAIHTPQELLLLHKVTVALSTPEKQLQYLRDPKLGPESSIAKGEWQIWMVKLQLLTQVGEWQELFDICDGLLTRARTKNKQSVYSQSRFSDWIVWEAYIRSAIELKSSTYTRKVSNQIEFHLDSECGIDKSWKRNASLALVKLEFDGKGELAVRRLTTVLTYLNRYGDANIAYNDLKLYVDELEYHERGALLSVLGIRNISITSDTLADKLSQVLKLDSLAEEQDFSTAAGITRTVNNYKLRYLILSSSSEFERRLQSAHSDQICAWCKNRCTLSCINCLGGLAQVTITSYKTAINVKDIKKSLATTDIHPADDLAILAAMCLVKLSGIHSKSPKLSNPHLMRAAAIMEFAATHSPSNSQITLLLIRLYTFLGCGSLAARVYQERLKTKQIQLNTLSYHLLDRVSYFHPHPYNHSGLDLLSPEGHIKKQTKFYVNAYNQISKNIWLSLKKGSYDSLFQISDVQDKLGNSIAKDMCIVEENRLDRLKGGPPAMSTMSFIQANNFLSDFVDTSDYDSFPNFESSKGNTFQELCRLDPAPSPARTIRARFSEILILCLQPNAHRLVHNSVINGMARDGQIDESMKAQHFSKSERIILNCHNWLTFILRHFQTLGEEITEEDIETVTSELGELNGWLGEDLKNAFQLVQSLSLSPESCPSLPAVASSTTLQYLYSFHELASCILKFCAYVEDHKKEVGEYGEIAVKDLQETASSLLHAILSKCKAFKGQIDEGGWMDRIFETVLPDEVEGVEKGVVDAIRELVGDEFMEGWAGEVVESWKDSVEGFVLLKPLNA